LLHSVLIKSNTDKIDCNDFLRFIKSLGFALFKASLFRIEFIFETYFNSFLTLSNSILFLVNSSIKSNLLLISSILFRGFMICSLRNEFHMGVFVLFKIQNNVHIVDDFVEKLYIKSKFLIVDSSKFIYELKFIYDN
jgi:hypothetical protein